MVENFPLSGGNHENLTPVPNNENVTRKMDECGWALCVRGYHVYIVKSGRQLLERSLFSMPTG